MRDESLFPSDSLCKCSTLKTREALISCRQPKPPPHLCSSPSLLTHLSGRDSSLPLLQEPEVSLSRIPKGNYQPSHLSANHILSSLLPPESYPFKIPLNF